VATARVLKWTIRENLTGFEGLTGVPGTIGGACIMNAGGRGGEIGESLVRVEVVTSPPEVHSVVVEADALMLAYRSSSLPPGSIIGRATFQFAAAEETGAVGRTVEELLEHRMATQPAGVLSVGSVFKNPEGDSAGRLIESCGLKGAREGPVVVNDMHANYLVNTGGATSRQVRTLIDRIRHDVREQTGIELVREVVTVGFPDDPLPERAWVPKNHPLRNRDQTRDREFGSVTEDGAS
jgi:UDP-N-acetylmuramate dehydrogenase